MRWQVQGMRRGRPGRWTVEASSSESARHKAEAAGVMLGRIDPIGQITAAAVAFALSPGRPAKPRRPVGWIAASTACAAVFGGGGYLLGDYFARTTSPAMGREVPAEARDDRTANAVAATGQAKDGSQNKTRVSFQQGR